MMANTRSGSAVITVLVLITVLLTIAGGLAYLHRVNGRLARNYLDEAQAMYLAEAGLAVAETVLRQDQTIACQLQEAKHRHLPSRISDPWRTTPTTKT